MFSRESLCCVSAIFFSKKNQKFKNWREIKAVVGEGRGEGGVSKWEVSEDVGERERGGGGRGGRKRDKEGEKPAVQLIPSSLFGCMKEGEGGVWEENSSTLGKNFG